jgi:hypothetical protein
VVIGVSEEPTAFIFMYSLKTEEADLFESLLITYQATRQFNPVYLNINIVCLELICSVSLKSILLNRLFAFGSQEVYINIHVTTPLRRQ